MSDSEHFPLVVYTPEAKIRHPLDLFKEMRRDLKASRELAWRLMVRDISAQYRQTYFGFAWAFFPPIATALVFVFLNSQKLINIGETEIAYPAFVMFGTVLWQVFVDSLNAPLSSFTRAKSMLAKISFSREALILSGLGQVLFDFGIRVIILVPVFVIFKVPVTWGLLLSPVAVLMLILLGITIGLLLVPIGLLYTDISRGLSVITGLWFFLTPAVYPVPKTWPLSLLGVLNPVSPLLIAARDLATKGVIENIWPFLIVSVLTLSVLFLGWVLMHLAMPIVIERMGG